MSTIAFVQARMGSSRLPGKVLQPLAGKPLLTRMIERLRDSRELDEVVVVSSAAPWNDAIASLCESAKVRCVRGSETDVLDRFYVAARLFMPRLIVRISADCPLIDPEVVDQLIQLHSRSPGLAYAAVVTSATGPWTGLKRFPIGLDAEVFGVDALRTAHQEALEPSDREHVTPFIWRRPDRFPAAPLECDQDYGDERWTVDYAADLELIRAVYERLGDMAFGWREVLEVLEREPSLRELNGVHRAARADAP